MKSPFLRQVIQTEDGSSSLFLPELNEHYHSIHGAMQESVHVFIREGFLKVMAQKKTLDILEVGFGTGLNCMLSWHYALRFGIKVCYTAIEPFPLCEHEYRQINYPLLFNDEEAVRVFRLMHDGRFHQELFLEPGFLLIKLQQKMQDLELDSDRFDLVYFDAFGPQVQPELWQEAVFRKLATSMKTGGILVTYAASGSVKRAMKASGFTLEHPPGPPGKREMTRAVKEQ